jgi:hypothetical protein
MFKTISVLHIVDEEPEIKETEFGEIGDKLYYGDRGDINLNKFQYDEIMNIIKEQNEIYLPLLTNLCSIFSDYLRNL